MTGFRNPPAISTALPPGVVLQNNPGPVGASTLRGAGFMKNFQCFGGLAMTIEVKVKPTRAL